MVTGVDFQEYSRQPLFPGPAYICEACHKKLSGGRHFLNVVSKPKWVCPDCWPDMLNRLEELATTAQSLLSRSGG